MTTIFYIPLFLDNEQIEMFELQMRNDNKITCKDLIIRIKRKYPFSRFININLYPDNILGIYMKNNEYYWSNECKSKIIPFNKLNNLRIYIEN